MNIIIFSVLFLISLLKLLFIFFWNIIFLNLYMYLVFMHVRLFFLLNLTLKFLVLIKKIESDSLSPEKCVFISWFIAGLIWGFSECVAYYVVRSYIFFVGTCSQWKIVFFNGKIISLELWVDDVLLNIFRACVFLSQHFEYTKQQSARPFRYYMFLSWSRCVVKIIYIHINIYNNLQCGPYHWVRYIISN